LSEGYIPEDQIDVVFASEYFEHIQNPIDHLNELIVMYAPKYFIICNAFNTRSIGHFNYYERGTIEEEKISKIFNNKLKSYGYEKIKTTLFNNKPNVWVKKK
jgi:hypothetical protein